MKYSLLFILLTVFGFSVCRGEVNQNHDFQLWLYQSSSKKINDKFRWYLDGELRYADHASQLYLFYVQTGLFYAINKCLDVAPGYRQQYILRLSDRKWRPVYQPIVDIFLKSEIKKWQISDRSRISYLIFESLPNRFQYRNRLMVKTPWKLGKLCLNPLLFDELFFREARGFTENRFAVGGSFPVGEKTQTTLLYTLRNQKFDDSWRRHNILWLQLHLSF